MANHDQKLVAQNALAPVVKKGFPEPPEFSLHLSKNYQPYWFFLARTQLLLSACL